MTVTSDRIVSPAPTFPPFSLQCFHIFCVSLLCLQHHLAYFVSLRPPVCRFRQSLQYFGIVPISPSTANPPLDLIRFAQPELRQKRRAGYLVR